MMSKVKSNLGLFGKDSSLDLNRKKVGNSPSFSSITYWALPAFHQLLIEPYLTNGLEETEF
jgi:hypothetical protein